MSLLLSQKRPPIETIDTVSLVDLDTSEGRAQARMIQRLMEERTSSGIIDGNDPGRTEPELPALRPLVTLLTKPKPTRTIPVPLRVNPDALIDCVWESLERCSRMHKGWIPRALSLPGNVYWSLVEEGITEVTYHGKTVVLEGELKLAPNFAYCIGD